MLSSLALGALCCAHVAVATTPLSHTDGCFGGALVAIGAAAGVARSVVHVAVVSNEGVPVISGTGVLMRGVRGDPRVVTAWHLVSNLAGRRIAVVSSDAQVLGEARVEVRGTNQAPASSETVMPGDIAILKVNWQSPALARGRGLLLAAGGRGGLIAGVLDRPAGGMPGISGAPVVDPKGRVLAIVVARTAPAGDTPSVEIVGGNLLAMHAQGGHYVAGKLHAPASSGFAAEVPPAAVALSEFATSQDGPPRSWKGDIVVPAVVRGHCVVLQGNLAIVAPQTSEGFVDTNP